MSLVVEDGTGLANAESLASVAEGDTFFTTGRGAASLYATTWTAATTGEKEGWLRWSCRDISAGFDFDGVRATTTQALPIPRIFPDPIDGVTISSTSVPADIKDAQLEQALALIKDSTRGDDPETGLKSATLGPLSATFDLADRPREVCRQARKLLRRYGVPSGGSSRAVERV